MYRRIAEGLFMLLLEYLYFYILYASDKRFFSEILSVITMSAKKAFYFISSYHKIEQ